MKHVLCEEYFLNIPEVDTQVSVGEGSSVHNYVYRVCIENWKKLYN